jgi:hypothetical protein
MLKRAMGLLAVLVIAGTVHAQEAAHPRLSQADLNALTDARIGFVKAMLQLTPDQAKLWAPVEDAMRSGAEARHRRIAQLRAAMERFGEREPDPISILRVRGEALSERGAQLKKLADAWQPLYQTLNPDQKQRVRLVASHVLHELKDAMMERRHHVMEHGEADEGEED